MTEIGLFPVPAAAANQIVAMYDEFGEMYFMEFCDQGVPLGAWYWCDDLEEWWFDEFPPPLAFMAFEDDPQGMPNTGGVLFTTMQFAWLAGSLLGVRAIVVSRNSRRREELDEEEFF
jgi:hypothetical protein